LSVAGERFEPRQHEALLMFRTAVSPLLDEWEL
jgi:hypothetical protein